MSAATARPELSQRLGTTQMPRLASRLLGLNLPGLRRELRLQAEHNPLLELLEPEVDEDERRMLAAPGPSLGEHLALQLETTPLAAQVRADALHCLVLLDDRGFLPAAAELATACGWPAKRARAARDAIRQLQPAGVGARDLADCLLLQLAAQPASDLKHAAERIIREHFDLLARNRYDLLPQSCPRAAVELIKQLQPNVASAYAQAAAYATPDLHAVNDRGYWRAQLRDPPQAQLREDYRRAVRTSGDARWRRLARSATALLDGLRFRQRALQAIAQAMVDRQRDYFNHGPVQLRPLRLRDLAAATGLASSTVSTVIKGKSIAGPYGTVPLRFLLQRQAAGGSAGALQADIQALVKAEDPRAPLSDAALAARLGSEHGAPSRRTVAKHRQRAGLLPARLRRDRN